MAQIMKRLLKNIKGIGCTDLGNWGSVGLCTMIILCCGLVILLISGTAQGGGFAVSGLPIGCGIVHRLVSKSKE